MKYEEKIIISIMIGGFWLLYLDILKYRNKIKIYLLLKLQEE